MERNAVSYMYIAYACALPCFKAPPLKLDVAWKQPVDCLPHILSFPDWLLLQPCWTSAGSWCRECQPH